MVLPLIDRLNENASVMCPSDGINFALNFDVVFQPVLGTTLRFCRNFRHSSFGGFPSPSLRAILSRFLFGGHS